LIFDFHTKSATIIPERNLMAKSQTKKIGWGTVGALDKLKLQTVGTILCEDEPEKLTKTIHRIERTRKLQIAKDRNRHR
jgi:hypothetical protein